jgi:hypothetical protein
MSAIQEAAQLVLKRKDQELTRLRAENAALREALEPFVRQFIKCGETYAKRTALAADWFEKMPDNWPMRSTEHTMGDYRKARAALQQDKPVKL